MKVLNADKAFETKNVEVLDKHTPQKTKLLGGNHKPHVFKKLRKKIIKRSQLKSTRRVKTSICISFKNKEI